MTRPQSDRSTWLVPLLGVAFGATLALVVAVVLHKLAPWMDNNVGQLLFYMLFAAGCVPLLITVLEFFSSRRAVLDIKGVKLDFSQTTTLMATPGVPKNIGLAADLAAAGRHVNESSPLQIVDTLTAGQREEIVSIDIEDGKEAWWVTRLLALCAGAVRTGTPRVIVFRGTIENIPDVFLGWGTTMALLEDMLDANPNYRQAYDRAKRATRSLDLHRDYGLIPNDNTLLSPYQQDPYTRMGGEVFEQILMDQLVRLCEPHAGDPTRAPDRLTFARITELFKSHLYIESIDISWNGEKQISAFLESTAPYLALVRNRRYHGLLKREDAERDLLRQLLLNR
jgi:hypothetical protein